MTNNNKQAKLNSKEEVNYKMRRSFSWDRAFFTSDGFLAPEELSSIIEGDRNYVKHELENMEAKMLQELEASTKKYASNITSSSIKLSSEKRDSKVKKVTESGGPHKDAPINTPKRRSSPSSGDSGGSPVKTKTPVRRSMSSKNGKANVDSPSQTPPPITTKIKVGSVSPGSSGSRNGKTNVDSPLKTPPVITTKNKVGSVNTRVSRLSPSSPGSPGSSGSSSSSSTFSVNQGPKWNNSVRCGSLLNNEKPISTNGRRKDDRKSSKPLDDLMPKSQSSIRSKIKPPPELSSSSTKPTSKKHPTRSPNGSNVAKLTSIKTVATANTGLKPKSPKITTPKKQSRGLESIHVISPEILDLKGKINALKMEINIHKDRCNKMILA